MICEALVAQMFVGLIPLGTCLKFGLLWEAS